jgi:hypothetical protein
VTIGRSSGEAGLIRISSRTPIRRRVEAGPALPEIRSHPAPSLPLPGSPAGRSQTPPLLPSARPVHASVIDRIKNAATWDELKRWAQIALGPFSFDLGVCFGIVEGVKDIGVGLFELLKMLPRRENLWVSGAFRTEPEGQQQAKTMPDSIAALSLSIASFLSGTSLPLPD